MKMMMEQKQILNIIMTKELRQAIELLQFSTYELMQFVQRQAEENPFIEFDEQETSSITYSNRNHRNHAGQSAYSLECIKEKDKGMHAQLLEQLIWMELTDEQYRIAHFLILNLNDQGFLALNNTEMAAYLNCAAFEIRTVKQILHQLEPIGIGARDVRECLLIQAYEKYPADSFLHLLIEKYLVSLADKKWQQIAKHYNKSLVEIKEVFEKIQTLNPRPATVFKKQIDYVTPDISITYDETKSVHHVQLNDHYIPRLYFNQDYAEKLPQSGEIIHYVQKHLKKFEWLQKSIVQRRKTIRKIMEVIVQQQEAFLQKGLRYLNPLTLKEVAREIGMHESTVSRATANKIVQTPSGTFELRDLFSTNLATVCGSKASQTTVKEMIYELLEEENKYEPLSDQKIAGILKQSHGVMISRRTVAKYRDELQIPSSSKRKEIQVI